jgi:hypothetical protein
MGEQGRDPGEGDERVERAGDAAHPGGQADELQVVGRQALARQRPAQVVELRQRRRQQAHLNRGRQAHQLEGDRRAVRDLVQLIVVEEKAAVDGIRGRRAGRSLRVHLRFSFHP